jgi:hypothetical protein
MHGDRIAGGITILYEDLFNLSNLGLISVEPLDESFAACSQKRVRNEASWVLGDVASVCF